MLVSTMSHVPKEPTPSSEGRVDLLLPGAELVHAGAARKC